MTRYGWMTIMILPTTVLYTYTSSCYSLCIYITPALLIEWHTLSDFSAPHPITQSQITMKRAIVTYTHRYAAPCVTTLALSFFNVCIFWQSPGVYSMMKKFFHFRIVTSCHELPNQQTSFTLTWLSTVLPGYYDHEDNLTHCLREVYWPCTFLTLSSLH